MSLSEAILGIADSLDEEANLHEGAVAITFRSLARELRTAVRASGGDRPVQQYANSPAIQHIQEIEKAREDIRRQKENALLADFLEKIEPRQVEAIGGGCDGTIVPVDAKMPVKAKTMINDEVYELREDGKLYLV